jgi:hypothetical protein
MRRKLLGLFSCATLTLSGVAAAFGQEANPDVQKPKGYFAVRPLFGVDHETVKAAIADTATSGMIPLWTFNVTSTRDGNPYSGEMVGRSAFNAPNSSTSIPTQIVPVIFIMPDGGVFDPTKADPCAAAPGGSAVDLVLGSPIVSNAHFMLNGVNQGVTQYIDAFQRANFSQVIGGNYHTLLNVTVLPAITVQVPPSRGATFNDKALFGACGFTGVIDINWWDPFVTGTIIPSLGSEGVNPTTFPVFLFGNVVMSVGSPSLFKKCCILGYHGAFGFPVQTYSPLDFDTSGIFGPRIKDTSIMAHEVGEWMDDPLGNNPTPAWGHTGQVGGCQNNLEVGDPLTGTNIPTVTMPNGFTYHLQELAFFSWFYGAPSIGAGGLFSDNGTFKTDAGPVCQ